jgi:hypothetical protein
MLGGGFEFFGARVTKNESERAAVGRPNEVLHILRSAGETFRFAAADIEKPDLGLAFVACGKESDGFAVRTPARVGGGNARGGEGAAFAACDGSHPDAGFVLVLLERGSLHGVGNVLGVGAELGVADGFDLEIVVDGDGAKGGSGLLSQDCRSGYQNRAKNREAKEARHSNDPLK